MVGLGLTMLSVKVRARPSAVLHSIYLIECLAQDNRRSLDKKKPYINRYGRNIQLAFRGRSL